MSNKRILFLTQVLPYPLDSGAKVRAYYVLRHLAQRHRVTLVSFTRPSDSAGAGEHLREFCDAVHTVPMRRSMWRDALALLISWRTGQPALIVRDRSSAFRNVVRRLLTEGQFDALHVDQTKTAQHVEALPARWPRLIDIHQVYQEMIEGMARLTRSRWRKRLLEREARAMARYESRICRPFNEILAVTDCDALRLGEMVEGLRPVTTLPICVDPVETPVTYPGAHSRSLIIFGAMFYPPNVDAVLWFLREILPRVVGQVPDVQVRVVGSRPVASIRRAAARDGRVVVTGYVSDIAAELAASAATVVPVRAGSGMRVKILEAMVRGIPVVSTRLGAAGICVEDGQSILLADSPGDFAGAVVRMLRDPDLRRRISENARHAVEEHYDWRRRYSELDPVYERLLTAGGSPR